MGRPLLSTFVIRVSFGIWCLCRVVGRNNNRRNISSSHGLQLLDKIASPGGHFVESILVFSSTVFVIYRRR